MKQIYVTLLIALLCLPVFAQDTKFGEALTRQGLTLTRESYEIGWVRGSTKAKVSAEVLVVADTASYYAVVIDTLETEHVAAQVGVIDFDELPQLLSALDKIINAIPILKADKRPMVEVTYKTRDGLVCGLTQSLVVTGQDQRGILRPNNKPGASTIIFPIEHLSVVRSVLVKAQDKLKQLGAR